MRAGVSPKLRFGKLKFKIEGIGSWKWREAEIRKN